MKKNTWLVGLIFSTALLCPLFSYAQVNNNTSTSDITQQRIKMHEYMMQMQQQAIDCLKSGKSENQCRQQYRQNMQRMHDQYWQDNDDHYWDDNWDNNGKRWHHGCCNMMNMMHH